MNDASAPGPDTPSTDESRKNAKVDNIVQQTLQNGMGDIILGLGGGGAGGFPGAFGGGMPYATGGSWQSINTIETVASNVRGWLISNQRTILSDLYAEHGLIETIVDIPVMDALRSGFEIVSSQLDPDDIAELYVDLEGDLGAEEMDADTTGPLASTAQAMKWTRLYGGGGLIIVTDQDPATPLDVEQIQMDRPLSFVDFDLWELYRNMRASVDPGDRIESEKHKYPIWTEYFEYYGRKVHRSRLIKMRGKAAPSFLRPRLQGWGLSVCETIIRSINQYLKSNALAFEVLDEFKLDIYNVEGFNKAAMTRDGSNRILQQMQLSNMLKNFQRALVLDKNDQHTGKQLSFTGIGDVMKEIRLQLASDLRMPMTKLFGMSAAGFNSGEDDIEVYNGMVESEVRTPLKPLLRRVVQMLCQRRFGFIPDDLQIRYRPMRILTAEQEENVKNARLTRISTALDKRIMDGREARASANQDNLLGVQVADEPSIEDALADELGAGGEDDTDAFDQRDQGDNADGDSQDREDDDLPQRTLNARSARRNRRRMNPGEVDEAKWSKAKRIVRKEYGLSESSDRFWKLVQGIYQDMTNEADRDDSEDEQ